MKIGEKTYRLTFTEYDNEVEDANKMVTVQYKVARDLDYPLTFVDVDYEIKRNIFNELKIKLGL